MRSEKKSIQTYLILACKCPFLHPTINGHHVLFTWEALLQIAQMTVAKLSEFKTSGGAATKPPRNRKGIVVFSPNPASSSPRISAPGINVEVDL